MSTGTSITQSALGLLGAHTPLQPAPTESLIKAKDRLNSLLAGWYDTWGIDMGTVPLETVGSELSEPLGATNWIEYCLAESLRPDFPGGQVNPDLSRLAREAFSDILSTWGNTTIPKVKVRGTLPKGQGSRRFGHYQWDSTFFDEGEEIA